MAGRPKKYSTEEERKSAHLTQCLEWRKNNHERYVENERLRRIKSADKIKVNRKKWQDANKEKTKVKRQLKKEQESKRYKAWRERNIERCREVSRIWEKKKKEEDPLYKFKRNISSLIYQSFIRNNKLFKKSSRTEEILGCKIEFFIDYITKNFGKALEVKDFSKYGYHIDHIIPISSAKTEEEVIKLCHYTNLQPLYWRENLQKSNKLP